MNEQELNAKIADVEKTLNELKQELIKSQKPKVVPKPGDIVVSDSTTICGHKVIHFIPKNIGNTLPALGYYDDRLGWNKIESIDNIVDNRHYKDHKVLTPTQVSKVYDFIVGLVKDQ